MQTRSVRSSCGLAAFSIVACSLACTSPAPASPPQSSADAKAATDRIWTKEFQMKSILSAREISIEGPPGLIDHVAFKQLPEQKYSAKTIPDGFLQEVSVPENAPNPIWLQLDNLAIAADKSARVLERVSAGPVRIHARGDVRWKNLETGQEQSGETLELVGQPAQ